MDKLKILKKKLSINLVNQLLTKGSKLIVLHISYLICRQVVAYGHHNYI